ncbi:acyltransferase [uncultured Demequina sp.]|uniref:acyltransferase family protein n=1 Tax=uncultured Demequina sp. TaxID=693499 RepID=UPI0025FC5109|nr:acyltransferase [uncultured Demequina sp.]
MTEASTTPAPAKRNSSIEALRIAAMVGIVAHHYAVHGGVMGVTFDQDAAVTLSVASAFGKWGVDLFVLVGAYFMVKRPSRGRSLASIYAQVLPISLLILATFLVVAPDTVSGTEIKKSVLPVIFGQYWFVTAYVMLVLIAPYLAMVATGLTRVQLGRLIAVGVALWSVLNLVDGVWLYVSDLAWFALLFMIASYMRLHPLPGSRGAWIAAAFGTGVAIPVAMWIATTLRWNATGLPEDLGWTRWLVAGPYSPLSLAFAVALLGAVLKSRERQSRVVNYWAAAAFGVYLIHDNPMVRAWVWSDLVETPRQASSDWLLLTALGTTLVIYVACSAIIFVLQPVVLRPALRVTTAIRLRVEARLGSAPDTPGPDTPGPDTPAPGPATGDTPDRD